MIVLRLTVEHKRNSMPNEHDLDGVDWRSKVLRHTFSITPDPSAMIYHLLIVDVRADLKLVMQELNLVLLFIRSYRA